jgi:hypothetical protein
MRASQGQTGNEQHSKLISVVRALVQPLVTTPYVLYLLDLYAGELWYGTVVMEVKAQSIVHKQCVRLSADCRTGN